ncbi:hypothetical protein IFM46972_09061 [Aspergillus udagawae]|uniref:Uncharacterized protein n=1 Tax=Aspergillus udagawae TaxID=91492 RepID=A0A8H3S2B2_9EURO|nr:hypothetical protein IFM46972_09061 [Aspergillus udagawae]
MSCRKRLAGSPVQKRTAKIRRKDSAGADADDNWSHEDGFEDGHSDEEYKPDINQDDSERNDSSAPEDELGEKDYTPKLPLFLMRNCARWMELSTLTPGTNKNRAWFKSKARKDWESFVETLTPKIIAVDATIPELPPSDIVFRIYRDIRFSRDQRPYKVELSFVLSFATSHFSAAFSRTGRRRPYACYYLHLDPGSSYVGGGLWAPEPQTIQLLRQSIDERSEEWRQVLSSEPFMSMFLPTTQEGTEAAVKHLLMPIKRGR